MTVAFMPVRVDPDTLALTLDRLERQDIGVWAYDDNTDPDSSKLLRSSGIRVLPEIDLPSGEYERGASHRWSGGAVSRVAAIKNEAIRRFLRTTDDSHLFLLDADVVLQDGTVDHLHRVDVPVVAATYWTRWEPWSLWQPNVWEADTYGFGPGWADRLRSEDHWRVAGLGACTLIRRDVLEVASFTPIPGWPSIQGEDRWFCMRAAVHGIPLTACTCVRAQPWHVYRPDDLDTGRTWGRDTARRWRAENLTDEWSAASG